MKAFTSFKKQISIALILFVSVSPSLIAQETLQSLSLDQAYQFLEEQYPKLENKKILREIYANSYSIIDMNKQLHLFLKSDGRLQTESPHIDLPEGTVLPFTIDVPLYSLSAYAEASYMIFDGGTIKAQKQIEQLKLNSQLQELEIEAYHLQQGMNHLFINLVLLKAQARMIELSIEDVKSTESFVSASVEEGVILESELQRIQVKALELSSHLQTINHHISSTLESIAFLTNRKLNENTRIEFPEFEDDQIIPVIQRPEQELFILKKEEVLGKELLIDAARMPKLNAFARAGVGIPNPLNFIDNSGSPFGLVGLQLSWKLSHRKQDQLKIQNLKLVSEQIENDKKSFEFNLRSKEAKYLEDLNKLKDQIELDKEIIALQGQILATVSSQLEEGVIQVADYTSQLNKELLAREQLVLHETNLLKLQLDFWNERGQL